MKLYKYIVCSLGIFVTSSVFGHEPWLLTTEQIKILNSLPPPNVFAQLDMFNIFVCVFSILIVLFWILLNYLFPYGKKPFTEYQQNYASLFLRIGTGTMLILLALGLIPVRGIEFISKTALIAPEFLISSNLVWKWLFWVELIIGFALLFGIYTRVCAITLLLMLIIVFFHYGMGILQYVGFYLGIIYYLVMQGGGRYAIFRDESKLDTMTKSVFVLQLLTGINFIYSAISIKFIHPNLDIAILTINHSITFGLTYAYFVFIMFVTEIVFGILIILGLRLQIISVGLLLIFIFLSFDVSENILAHSFIYGILLSFIITGGVPIISSKQIFFKK